MYKILDNPEKSFVKCPQNLTKKVHVPKASRGRCFFTFGKLGESVGIFFDKVRHSIYI